MHDPSAPGTPTSCLQGAKHSDVKECHQQQDADVARGLQVHNLSLRAHLRLGRRGTTAGGIPYCRCQERSGGQKGRVSPEERHAAPESPPGLMLLGVRAEPIQGHGAGIEDRDVAVAGPQPEL